MKKKVLSVILALGILTSSAAVFAEETSESVVNPLENTDVAENPAEAQAQYIIYGGPIAEVNENRLTIQGKEEFFLDIADDALVYNNKGEKLTKDDLKADVEILGFVNVNTPAPLIEPPVYTPDVFIVLEDEIGSVTVDTFRTDETGRLTNQGYTLSLNLPEDAKIVDEAGADFEGDLEGRDLIVFYSISTMSIPAQTTPELIVVMDQEQDTEKEDAAETEPAEEMPVGYGSQTGTVAEIGDMIHVEEGENVFDVNITDDTLILNQKGEKVGKENIQKGTKISIFADGNKPMIMIYPPRYTADVVVVLDEEDPTSVTVDRFVKMENGSYLSSGRTLVMHHNEEVKTVGENGEAFTGDLEGRSLVVFYTVTTRSLPPQTTPELVIVLDEEQPADSTEVDLNKIYRKAIANGTEITIDVDDASITGMVPVRSVSEALGLEVGWDNVVQAVSVGTVPMGVNFNVGVNQYNKARMTPFTLSKAPVQITMDDENYAVTFVPVDFYSEVLGAEVKAEGETLYIDLAE